VLVALSVALVRRTRGLAAKPVAPPAALLTKVTFVLMWVAVWLGTVVTGSGPHAGDELAIRTGLDPSLITHVHAAAVYATVAATLGCLLLLRSRAAVALLAIELVQALIGIVQYRLDLPILLVLLHLLGAAVAVALATNLMLSVRSCCSRWSQTSRIRAPIR
jgi:cytochrome c oxidase assembly protein subunit 15